MDILIDSLTYKNSDKTIFNNTTFKFERKTYIIKGVNGSGKTTLLNLIYGMDKKYKGNIFMGGDKISKNKKEKISYIRQDIFLFENMTVNENILLLLTREEYNDVVGKIKGFNDFSLNDKVKNLSGGQKKILDLLIGISKQVEVFLVDEPFNNLSKKRIEFAVDLLMRLKGLVIVVDHSNSLDKEENIETLILRGGKIVNYE